MNGETKRRPEPRLEVSLGLILAIGVAAGLALQIAGMLVYWRTAGGLAISSDPSVFLSAEGFFTLLGDLFRPEAARQAGLGLMTVGIVVLILTPLARVITSVVYFAARRDAKYLVLTLLVLAILLASLALH